MIICIDCGEEIDEGSALNGYCEECIDKFVEREESEKKNNDGKFRLPQFDVARLINGDGK